MPLNTDQKRFLAAALMELEEHLLRFETLLQSDETVTVFRRVVNPFPPERRTQLLTLIGEIKKQLQGIRDAFNLPTETVDLRWSLSVTLLHLATNLEECEPKRLKAFGELDKETAEALAHHLRQLVRNINAIQRKPYSKSAIIP